MKIEEVPAEAVEAIREQYGVRTRAALKRQFGLTDYMFDAVIKKYGIERIDPKTISPKLPKHDYMSMKGVPVPGLPGNVIVYSNKDPEVIIEKYQNREGQCRELD